MSYPDFTDLIDKLEKIEQKTNYPVCMIKNGKSVVDNNDHITVWPEAGSRFVEWISGTKSYKLKYEEIGFFGRCIDTIAYAGDVYKSMIFKNKIYPTATRGVAYFGIIKQEECLTCAICGIILPRRYMHLDYQRPPAHDGKIESVAKLLRVLNLTHGGPKGHKCTQLHAAIQPFIRTATISYQGLLDIFLEAQGIETDVTPKKLRPITPSAATLDERYSLNELGLVFYSVVLALDMQDMLQNRAVKNLANMRRLCWFCKVARGSPLKYPRD